VACRWHLRFDGVAWAAEWLHASFFPFVMFAFCIPLGWSGVSLTFPLRVLVVRDSGIICTTCWPLTLWCKGPRSWDPSGRYQ